MQKMHEKILFASRSLIIYGDKVETFDPYYRVYTTYINFNRIILYSKLLDKYYFD